LYKCVTGRFLTRKAGDSFTFYSFTYYGGFSNRNEATAPSFSRLPSPARWNRPRGFWILRGHFGMVQPILDVAIITGENLFSALIDTPERPMQFDHERHKSTPFPISTVCLRHRPPDSTPPSPVRSPHTACSQLTSLPRTRGWSRKAEIPNGPPPVLLGRARLLSSVSFQGGGVMAFRRICVPVAQGPHDFASFIVVGVRGMDPLFLKAPITA